MRFKSHEDVPRNMRASYFAQVAKARASGVRWDLTMVDWANWWLVDDRWERRGSKRASLKMARIDDSGPFSLDNIRCVRNDGSLATDAPVSLEPARPLQGKRGDLHPRSQPVITPAGRFASAALAAEFYGKARQVVARWARTGHNGFRYDDDIGSA